MLASCGSEKYQGSPLVQAVGAVAKATVSKVAAKRSGATAAAPAPVTRADLEKFGVPILRAVIAARGADALLTISDAKGGIVTWSTTDGTTFTLRNGVLIQTRGLGPDLMSAQAPSFAALQTNGSTHQRIYFLLGPDDRGTRRTYDCTVSVGGKEKVEIFGRSHTTTRVTETCVRPQDTISNEYWIEGQVIRKSRQLVSGGAGFIDFEQVVD
jgi:hypothetical protein